MLPVAQDEHEAKALADIARHGLHIKTVLEEGDEPGFSYSVGLWHSYRHPEVIIIGLKREISQWILNEIARRIAADGERFEPGPFYDGLLEGFACVFRGVPRAHFPQTVTWDRWLYDNDDFPVLQCVWPTTEGHFPWDSGASESFRAWQPVLDRLAGGDFI